MNSEKEKMEHKMRIQGILTETIDDNELAFHHFSPIQESYGYPELKEIEENK